MACIVSQTNKQKTEQNKNKEKNILLYKICKNRVSCSLAHKAVSNQDSLKMIYINIKPSFQKRGLRISHSLCKHRHCCIAHLICPLNLRFKDFS